jgi:NADPH:quinone reductase-like Zn-dependent oxidoreductase
MPSKLLFEEAAALPLAGLAAYQALFGKSGLDAGSTVLIHAGSGGVGHLAIQLAKNAGATVFATAGSKNQQFILGLGAKTGIDYTDEDFAEAVRRRRPDGIDLVVDTVGGETTSRSLSVLRSGGRLVSLVQSPDPDEARRCEVQAYLLTAQPDAEQLGLMARMVDRGQLRPEVQKIYALKEAGDAHQALEEGHVRGKLVLNL